MLSASASLAVLSGFIELDEITDPANPAADKYRLYVNDVGGTTKLMGRDSAGTETEFGSGGLTSWTFWYPTSAGTNSNNINSVGPYVGGPSFGVDPGYFLNAQIGSIQWSSSGQTYHFQHRLSPNFNGTDLTFTLTGANANSGVVNSLSVAGRCYGVGDDLDTPTVNQFTSTVNVSIDLSAGGNTLESGSVNTWSSMPCVAGDLLILAVTRPATLNTMTTAYFAITEGW